MNTTTWHIARVLAALQLLKALELHGAYTFQWARLTSGQSMSLAEWAIAFAALLFLILPIAAVFGLFRNKQWGFYPLIAFPAVAAVFGAIPIPFLANLYSTDVASMSGVIVAVNLVFVGVGVLLLWKSGATAAEQ